MALSNTAQPINTSLRKVAVVVATAVAGMSAFAHAAETPKKKILLPLPLHLLHRKVPGDLLRLSPLANLRPVPKQTPQFKRFHSLFLW